MHLVVAIVAMLVLIAVAAIQMRSRGESDRRDFVIVAVIAGLIVLHNTF